MSEALETDAPAQAAFIATEEVTHPVEEADDSITDVKPEVEEAVTAETKPDDALEAKTEIQSEPALSEVKAEVKPKLERPLVEGETDDEIDTLLAKAAKQGTLPSTPRHQY